MAVNCWLAPTAMLAVGGVTAIEVRVGGGAVAAVMVRAAVLLALLSEAVMVAVPVAIAVARPEALTLAAAVSELVQVTDDVTLAVELSLYVAIAVNCCVAPTAMLAVAGVTVMDERVFCEGLGEEVTTWPPQPAKTREDTSVTNGKQIFSRNRILIDALLGPSRAVWGRHTPHGNLPRLAEKKLFRPRYWSEEPLWQQQETEKQQAFKTSIFGPVAAVTCSPERLVIVWLREGDLGLYGQW